MATKERIEILVVGVKSDFENWIHNRGGVKVWRSQNLSAGGDPDTFTPALTDDPNPRPYPSPGWRYRENEDNEIITDIKRFRFVVEMREVMRFRIALKRGSGMSIVLTDGSTNKLKRACEKIEKEHGVAPGYHFDGFDGRECVIEIPVFED